LSNPTPTLTETEGKPPHKLWARWTGPAIFAIYTLLALLFTMPAPLTVTSAIVGDGHDGWQDAWEMWWLNRALQTGSPPYHFSTLYAPDGATLYIHSLNPIEIVLALPVQWLFGVIPAYNFAAWLALILTAFGGYLLGRDVTGSRLAGFIAGLVVGFAPHQFAHLLGHLDVVSIQFFVLGVWCLYRAIHSAGRPALVWSLWSAACLSASALTHPYSLISAIIAMLLMGTYYSLRKRDAGKRWLSLAKTALSLLVGLAVVSPFLFAMFRQVAGPDAPRRREITEDSVRSEIKYYSADLLAHFIPSPFHPLWGGASRQALEPMQGGLSEKVVFPGYAVMVLALVGAISSSTRRKARPWWLLALLGFVISLGPSLHIGGVDTGLTLPADLLYSLPGTFLVRVPARFNILVMLGLAVCAALGAQALLRHPRVASWRPYSLAALPLLIGLEFFTAPYRTSPFEVEAWWDRVAVDRSAYSAVLEVPFDRATPDPLRWQIASGLPLAGGYLSRQPVYPLSSGVPPFSEFGLNRIIEIPLFDRTRDTLCRPLPAEAIYLDLLRLARVRYVVLHLDKLSPDDPRLTLAARLFPVPPIYKSDTLAVYDTGGGEPAPGLFGVVEDIEDWYPFEEGTFRWSNRTQARLQVWSGSEQEVSLKFKLASFNVKRNVIISTGDDLLGAGRVDPPGRIFTLEWRAPKGFSTILISASGPPIPPASVGVGDDQRPLSISLADCTYARK
jgi:4-amino-4-deoxy-L-arabinose transferase-like glycosyltransferase